MLKLKKLFAGVLLAVAICINSLTLSQAQATGIVKPDGTLATTQQAQTLDISCDLMQAVGLQGEYVRFAAGPRIEPHSNSFVFVVSHRLRNADFSWTNNYEFIAERVGIDCKTLVVRPRVIQAQFGDATSDINFYYPDGETNTQGRLYAYFGTNTRDNTAAYNVGILDVSFGLTYQNSLPPVINH